MLAHHEPQRAFDELVATRYRLYSGLFLGLPYDVLRRVGQILPVFTEFCRKGLAQGQSPRTIIDRFFADNLVLVDVERNEALFLFLQLVERQIVLFDALEAASFSATHDTSGTGTVSPLLDAVLRDDRREDLSRLLDETATRIVLTAHPTQFYPDSVQHVIGDLSEALRENDAAEVERLLRQLGKTRFSNRQRPTPIDEARRVMSTLEDVFYDVLPEITKRVLATANGTEPLSEHLPACPNLQVGFWPGGDRDGNPFVTAETTLEVARQLKERVLQQHHLAAVKLARRLTFDGVHERMARTLERLRVSWLLAAGRGVSRSESPDQVVPYHSAAELLDELLELRRDIVAEHQGLYLDEVEDFILKVHLFGFYFASLDVRQSSDVFLQALREIVLARVIELGLGESERDTIRSATSARDIPLALFEDLLIRQVELPAPALESLTPLARDAFEVLRRVPEIQQSNGERGLHRVVISHAGCPQDVLVVLVLAHLAGVPTGSLDIVPLFESIEDLQHAETIVARLLDSPVYRGVLDARGRRQVVMVGFSDGTKDGGYLTANWSIRQAKRRLTALGRQRNVQLVFFDGRGGPPARGGGNTHRFYRSRDANIEQYETQLTIQGQTISSNFGNREMARFHVEQLYTANLENLLFPGHSEDPPAQYVPLLDEMSQTAYEAYRELRDDERLMTLLDRHSPLPLFEQLTIASRPVSRRAPDKFELASLRAIPFVAAWSVLKIQISGFYGLGAALQSMIDAGREPELLRLYRDSRFLRTLLDNAAMSLLKSRFDVSAYLGDDPDIGPFWRKIRDEAMTAERCILRISRQPFLLANDPLVRDSVRLREETVLPLLVVVHDAFTRYNEHRAAGTLDTEAAAVARKMALKGIAAVINATRNAA